MSLETHFVYMVETSFCCAAHHDLMLFSISFEVYQGKVIFIKNVVYLKTCSFIILFSGSQTSLHSIRLTTTTMVQNGEEKFKGTPAEEWDPILMLILLPLAASVLLFSIFIFICCRMKRKIFFIYLIFLLPNMRK